MSGLDRTRAREALELVDYSSGRGRCYDGATRDRRLDLLIEHFINEFPASPAELRIATSTIEEEIRDILSEAADRPRPSRPDRLEQTDSPASDSCGRCSD